MGAKIKQTALWCMVLIVACFAVSFAVISVTSSGENEGSYQPEPSPDLAPVAATKSKKHRPSQLRIAPSPAMQVYIPSENADLTISSKVHPLKECMPIINPPSSGTLAGSVFGCRDFAQPGTHAKGLTILTGHSSVRFDAAFNRLNKMNKAAVGKKVLVRTEKSGKRWLVYSIQSVYRPLKEDLPYRTDIWGNHGESLPGRLVLVTCFMKEDGSVADYNLIMVAQLTGVR